MRHPSKDIVSESATIPSGRETFSSRENRLDYRHSAAHATCFNKESNVSLRSRDYFRAMSHGQSPPDKDRWEEPQSRDNRSGITVGLLRLLNKQVTYCPPPSTE